MCSRSQVFLREDFTKEPCHEKSATIPFEKNKGADGLRHPTGLSVPLFITAYFV